jgi:predicted hydrocarbon binding protein
MAARLARNSYGDTRATARVRAHGATINLRSSVFCEVREPVGLPLCGFYAAAFARLLARFDMAASAVVATCRGTGEGSCVLEVSLAHGLAHPMPADKVA